LTTDTPGYLLDPRGAPIQEMDPLARAVFILTDQLSLPKNTQKGLMRKGVTSLSLGTQMLFASQCISVLHSRLTH
jgi:tRNA (pseudouridine54-N1)-methyltransferase